jgi:hypothetical protein
MNKNNFWFGFLISIAVTIFGVLMVWCVKFLSQNIMLDEFLHLLKENHAMIPKTLSLAMLAYIPLITYYKNRKRIDTLKGIFGAIILFAIIILLYKFNVI